MSLNKKLICIIVISAIALSAVIAVKTLKPDNDTDFKRGILVKRQAEPAPTSRTISDIHPIPRTKSDVNHCTAKTRLSLHPRRKPYPIYISSTKQAPTQISIQ